MISANLTLILKDAKIVTYAKKRCIFYAPVVNITYGLVFTRSGMVLVKLVGVVKERSFSFKEKIDLFKKFEE